MSKKSNKSSDIKLINAKVKYVRVSPYKLRKVADIVRQLPANDALNQTYLDPLCSNL